MDKCPCGSGAAFEKCCQPILAGKTPAPTAEALMRARYTAYAKTQIPFLGESLIPEGRATFDEPSARKWSESATWQGLEIVSTHAGGAADTAGTVRFIARYSVEGKPHAHEEVATFRKEGGRWLFVDGQAPKSEPVVREAPKVGRNDPCPCGSGKKSKKCCAAS